MPGDEELVEQARRGDDGAFALLVSRHENSVQALCRRYLGEDESRDAAQDVFITAHKKLVQLQDARRIGGWLRKIAFSVCMNRARKRKRERVRRLAHEDAVLPDPAAGPQEQAERGELAAAVMDAVQHLPRDYREPVKLFYLEGAAHINIAERLGMRAGAVRVRLHRARQMLRAKLQAYSPADAMSRSKEGRLWLPSNLVQEESRTMALRYERTTRTLMRGDLKVTVRPMRREDIPALRRFDKELIQTLDEVNAQSPPDGTMTYPGGPWSDDAELRDHFNKYAERGNLTLLAEEPDGRVVGFADLWATEEPKPFGRSLDVECIDYFREYYLAGLETILLTEAEKVARAARLPALDIGTNTCSGDYVSLRRFGMRVFYEYDNVLCRCRKSGSKQPRTRVLTPQTANLAGLIRVNHWSPTDFTFRADEKAHSMIEMTWTKRRAILELWRFEAQAPMDSPVTRNVPNSAELYAQPSALTSPREMTELLRASAALAAEAGAKEIALPCPSDLSPDTSKVKLLDRRFLRAWLRKVL